MLLFRNKIHNFRIQFTKLDSSWGQGPRRHFETGGSRFIFCRGIHMIRQNFPCFPFFARKKWGGFGPLGPPTNEGPEFNGWIIFSKNREIDFFLNFKSFGLWFGLFKICWHACALCTNNCNLISRKNFFLK